MSTGRHRDEEKWKQPFAPLPCIVKQYIITLAFYGHICSHMIKPSISILRWMFHFTPFDCVPSAAMHISFTRQVKSAAPFIRHVVRRTYSNTCMAANPAQMLHGCRRCSGCSPSNKDSLYTSLKSTWFQSSSFLFHSCRASYMPPVFHWNRVKHFFPCCICDSFYNKGLINGSQVSNPLPSTIAQRLMRKWENSFVAACLCSFLHVMLFRTSDCGKWSADYISDPFSDSGCRFT